MYGFGDPSGQHPDSSLGPAGAELPVSVDHFGWGFGDPVPKPWSGSDLDWGFGDPATLLSDHVLWVSPKELPDDGGEIVMLVAEWPSVGPYTVRCVQSHTGQLFPEADAPLPFCNSPTPGNGERCYTNVIEEVIGGVIVPTPGTTLRFVLPVLPPGRYDVQITPPGGLAPILLTGAMEVIWRGRAMEVYAIRNRWPMRFASGQRAMRYEDLLGYDPASDEEVT